jgi:hypothetical protein
MTLIKGNLSTDLPAKIEQFKTEFAGIQKKYTTWFRKGTINRPQRVKDQLTNHCFIALKDEHIIFGFLHNSTLPQNIRKECIRAFNKIFNDITKAKQRA